MGGPETMTWFLIVKACGSHLSESLTDSLVKGRVTADKAASDGKLSIILRAAKHNHFPLSDMKGSK